MQVNIKDIYVIVMKENKYVVKFDGDNIFLVNLNNGSNINYNEDKIASHISNNIGGNIMEVKQKLKDIQKIISTTNSENIIENINSYLQEKSQQSSLTNSREKIEKLEDLKNQIISNGSSENNEIKEVSFQKQLSNGKSLLGKQDAFINAMVLALIVEMVSIILSVFVIIKIQV